LIAALVFESLPVSKFKLPDLNLDSIASENILTTLVDERVKVLGALLEQHYPNSIIPTLFKNLKKCEHLANDSRTVILEQAKQ
jgi:hypothetical protein